MKKIFLFFLIITSFQAVIAQKVNQEQASLAGTNFIKTYCKDIDLQKRASGMLLQKQCFVKVQDNDTTLFVFNLIDDKGFVIVSADYNHIPVLGFSFENNLDFNNIAPALNYWLNGLSEDVSLTKQLKIQREDINSQWQQLITGTITKGAKDVQSVDPLLTSKWNQDAPYNELCPEDESGPGGHTYVGCVATAMAQIMNYYKYPAQGQSSLSYNSGYGYLTVNFGQANYNFDAMPNSLSNASPLFDIAQLGYHAAVSVKMNFSGSGSGAQSFNAVSAFRTYFKYAQNIQMVQKYNYINESWESLLKTQLNATKPVYYAGIEAGASSGHAFVCDGYKIIDSVNYFHFNWGWGGSGDAFVLLSQMNSGNGNFSSSQTAIINIYPADPNYPYGCQGTKTLTSYEGNFNDGSGPANYIENANCSFLLAPEHPQGFQNMTLSFDYFETVENDGILSIYEGENEQGALIGTYSGNTLPANITVNSPKIYLTFTSSEMAQGNGWQINYKTTPLNHCDGLTTLTDLYGTFSDGSEEYEYNNGSMCRWRIEPPGAESINLTFNSFDTEENNDYILITNAENNQQIGKYSGSQTPASISIPSSKVQVRFVTNEKQTAQGWSISYTSSPNAIPENSIFYDLSIWPNPATNNLIISSSNLSNANYSIEVVNLSGQVLYKTNTSKGDLTDKHTIDVSAYPQGVYFLRISDDGSSMVKKFVKN